jgi:hypothetical protein
VEGQRQASDAGVAGREPGSPPGALRLWSRGSRGWWLVEGAVAEHREEHVGSASGEVEDGLGVMFSLGDLLVVVGAGGRVGQRGECREEEGSLELLVSSARRLFATDGRPGTSGRRGEANYRRRGGRWTETRCRRRRR